MSPKRIQRRRTRGWRMPEGAVYVGRPSKWGNPAMLGRWVSADRSWRRGERGVVATVARTAKDLVLFYEIGLGYGGLAVGFEDHPESRVGVALPSLEDIRSSLRGKDLACWCPLDQPCHADVLLEIANGGAE